MNAVTSVTCVDNIW